VQGIIEIATVEVERTQQERWLSGRLASEWKRRFPELFDEDDLRLAQGPQGPKGYHFVEWLAAIVLHHTTGYLSLVSKYEFRNHPAKQRIVAQLLAPEVRAALRDRVEHGSAQPPDLLMYAPDLSDWFFCEVKGPGDALRPQQVRKFDALATMTGRPVRLLRLRWASRRTAEKASPALGHAPREAAATPAPREANRKGRVFDTEAILAAAQEPITEKDLAEETGYVEQYEAGTFRGLLKLYVRQGLMTRPTEDTVQAVST
jgi:hypothetical protein